MNVPCSTCERPVGDGLRLCETCAGAIIEALQAVPGLLADLETARAGQARISTGRAGGKSADAPLPIADTTDEENGYGLRLVGERQRIALTNAISTWARVLAAYLRTEVPIGSTSLRILAINARPGGDKRRNTAVAHHTDASGRRRAHVIRRTGAQFTSPVSDIEQAAMWMACHRHELRELEAASEAHREITRVVAALRGAIDRPPDLKYYGRCPTLVESTALGRIARCNENLYAEPGQSFARCRRCRMQHDVYELQDAAAEAARDRLCTMPEILRTLATVGTPVGKTTGFRWAREGKLTRRKWLHRTEHGDQINDRWRPGATPVYRLGDALELARRVTNEEGSTA